MEHLKNVLHDLKKKMNHEKKIDKGMNDSETAIGIILGLLYLMYLVFGGMTYDDRREN